MTRSVVLSFALVALACAGGPVEHFATPAPAPSPSPASVAPPGEPGPAASAHAKATGPGENPILQGTPEIPAALKERLGQYLDTRSAALSWVGDDGKSVLVTTRFAETDQVHLVRRPLGARTQLTFEDEPVRYASLTPKGDAALYMSDSGGDEQFQIRRLELASGKTQLLTDGKSRHGRYVWSRQGDRISYTSNARNGKDMDIYLGDGKSAAAGRLVLERSGHWYPIEFSRDGNQLLVAEFVSINESRLFLVDVKTAQVKPVTPASPPASYRAAALSPDASKVYLATDREGEVVQLYEVDLGQEGAAWKPLTAGSRWNVTELALSPDGGSLAFVTNEDGYGVLHVLDTRTRRQRPVRGVPRGIVSGLAFARQAPVLGFSVQGATENGDAHSYDLRTGAVTRWTESEIGGLPRERFVEPSLFRHKSFDGLEIPCFYYRPREPGPHPVLVWIHGGPESQSRPTFSSLLQYLVVESGMAVLVPNVRGSDGYGKSYLLLDNADRREDSVKDIGALLDWVAQQSELDHNRMAVLGASYGGYMVLASLFHYPSRLVAGVDIVGISNFVTFLQNTKDYRRDLRRAEYGDERDAKMRAHLTRISPTTNAHRIQSARFVAHGANDPRVPLSETNQIVEAVRKNGKDVWYMVAKNEGHGFRKKENRDLFTLLTVLFLQKHLGKP